MKNGPKYLKEKPKKKGVLWIILLACILVAVAVLTIVALTGGSEETPDLPDTETTAPEQTLATEALPEAETTELPAATEETGSKLPSASDEVVEGAEDSFVMSSDGTHVIIDSAYCQLLFPAQYCKYLRYDEYTQGAVTTQIFSFVKEDMNLELFRIYYGDAETGEPLGMLNTGTGDVPITFTAHTFGEESFADEESWLIYNGMMDGFSVVLNSIYVDSRYMPNQSAEPSQTQDVELSFWTVDLPEEITWEETQEGGNYQVDFFGNVNGEKIPLYRVSIGDTPLKTVLGNYTINGTAKPVSVEACDMPTMEGWPEREVTRLYDLMETINDVIQVIMSSEEYSAE